jgi:hypothetical protein
MEVWTAYADAMVKPNADVGLKPIVSARPPELLDLARKSAVGATAVIYPDPPISLYEQRLLNDAFPDLKLIPLSEVLR